MFSRILGIALVIFFISCSPSKKIVQNTDSLLQNLQKHVSFLSDDKLEGRRAGTAGERLAMEYIEKEFKQIGLEPKGVNDYFQTFDIYEGKIIGANTVLTVEGETLETGKDFFPFPYSVESSFTGLASPAIKEANGFWLIDIKTTVESNIHSTTFNLSEYLYKQAKEAQDDGAKAIFFYNTSAQPDIVKYNGKDKSASLTIPVFYLQKNIAQKYFSDETESHRISGGVVFTEGKRTGSNVIGYINNNAENTIVIGAHFDHIGYGEDGNSRAEKIGEIHNGADDNASGTAALIEIASLLKKEKHQKNNYLFIAFGAEELGLLGSKYFVDNPTINLSSTNYMINMDMIGRLNDSTLSLTIGGFGTSPQWSEVITLQKFLIPSPETSASASWLNIKIDSSGTGASDHTSFYRKNIPVLFYFTGLHSDYHKPSDDSEKINYAGKKMIVLHIYNLIQSLNSKGKLAFTPTREQQTSTTARFSVGLGLMPDYAFSGTGVRADGVTSGRAAEKAGMKEGDIVIGLGSFIIKDMESYMQALSKFKKGDKTTVKYKRGEETIEAAVEF